MRRFLLCLVLALAIPNVAQAQNAIVKYVGADGKAANVTPTTPLPTLASISGNSLCHIATAATTTCKTGAGMIHTLTVNSLGTVASLTKIYDNTAGSGTVVASINTLAGQTTYLYDISFSTGLTVVTTGTVAPDITVSYR